MTDYITDKSIDLIDQFSKDKKPFFYMWHTPPRIGLCMLCPGILRDIRTNTSKAGRVTKRRATSAMIDLKLIDPETCKLLPNSSESMG